MGRTARYKRIKSVDPYSKKNGGKVDLSTVGIWGLGDDGRKAKKRSQAAEKLRQIKLARRKNKKNAKIDDGPVVGFNLAPSGGDDFDMSDITGSVKKQEPVKNEELLGKSEGITAKIPETDRDEKRAMKLLKLDTQVEAEAKKSSEPEGRKVGESKTAYNKRVNIETQQIIQRVRMEQLNPEKRRRKKEFLTNKKKLKKGRGKGFSSTDADSDDEGNRFQQQKGDSDGLVTGEQAFAARNDEVKFGEQAECPPVFRQLPRGSKLKDNMKISLKGKRKNMTEQQIQAEQAEMEKMRRQVQMQYALIKAKRKQNRDFHL